MALKSKRLKKQKKRDISRREFLKASAFLGALPFALIIPSNATAVVTSEERLRPFRARQSEFYLRLQEKMAQIPGPGPVPKPPPPPPKPVPINTAEETSINTPGTEETFSGKPIHSDDTNYVTIYDGSKTDYSIDYR